MRAALDGAGVERTSGLEEALLDAWRAPEPMEGAAAVLGTLADGGWRLAALTNAGEDTTRRALRCAGLGGRPELLISAEASGRLKPNAAAYVQLATRLGRPAAAVWYVTAQAWDARGAVAAGHPVILLGGAGHDPPEGVVGRLPSIAGLPTLAVRLARPH